MEPESVRDFSQESLTESQKELIAALVLETANWNTIKKEELIKSVRDLFSKDKSINQLEALRTNIEATLDRLHEQFERLEALCKQIASSRTPPLDEKDVYSVADLFVTQSGENLLEVLYGVKSLNELYIIINNMNFVYNKFTEYFEDYKTGNQIISGYFDLMYQK